MSRRNRRNLPRRRPEGLLRAADLGDGLRLLSDGSTYVVTPSGAWRKVTLLPPPAAVVNPKKQV